MKAAVVRVFGRPLTIEEVPIPTPGPGEVLIKVVRRWPRSSAPASRRTRASKRPKRSRDSVRGSIAGTRTDLAEAIAFAAEGKVRAYFHEARLDEIRRVLSELKAGKSDGRIVLRLT
jgi:D-arabinose 1-dehydrogenase-like Zn-dependent alcohol dehydrogenase